jgi:hypothetical protein
MTSITDNQREARERESEKVSITDMIGQINIRIVKLDEEIERMKERLHTAHELVLAQSLREKEAERENLRVLLKQYRYKLIGKLEIELESVQRMIRTAHPGWNEGGQTEYEIKKELELLRKLVA